MELRRIKYPSEDFFSFKNGVNIGDKTIEEWVNKCVETVKEGLKQGDDSPYAFTASGNTIVFVTYSQDVEDDVFADENYFNIIVAKGYEEGMLTIGELKEEETQTICMSTNCKLKDSCNKNIKNIKPDVDTFTKATLINPKNTDEGCLDFSEDNDKEW